MRGNISEAMIRAESKGVLNPADLDLTIQDPQGVRESMAPIFTYSARVEKEVERDAATITSFLPHLNPEHHAYVQGIWLPQELAHGFAHELLLKELDHPELDLHLTVDPKIKALGRIANLSERLHRVFFMTYAARGAIHERTTGISYHRQIRMLKTMGEQALVDTMFKPIAAQEAPHLEVYRHMARDTWNGMPQWEQWLARQLLARTFSPVGTANAPKQSRPHFGEVALLLAGDQQPAEFMEPVIRLTSELMSDGSDILPRSVLKSVQRCVDEAREPGKYQDRDEQ